MDVNTKDVFFYAIGTFGGIALAYIARQVRKVEIATNSMKDAMVVSAKAEGKQEERDEQKARNVDLAAAAQATSLAQAKKKDP